ncbi:MAG: LLM class F420-dependent oxidoreductase [Acidimicrobiales bacterium]
MDLGRVGIWWSGRWASEEEPSLDVPAAMEALGYGALWCSGGLERGLARRFGRLLEATGTVAVASGIVSIWTTPPSELAAAVAELDRRSPGRFVLGLGASHAVLAADYARPWSSMVAYLDGLDAPGGATVPAGRRVLAALGPRMLKLAAERAAGAHPYLVPVEHTVRARQILGAGPVLAPEVTAVLESDPTAARAAARGFIGGYLTLPNYANNLRSLGFADSDLAGEGSDRLVDAVVAWGDVGAVAARVREHLAAGADHVCVQVVSAMSSFPVAAYRALAPPLLDL